MNTYQNQNGAALIVSLILLLVLTLIGTTAMQSTTLNERMASNSRSVSLAFEGAEAALREGEAILNQASLPPFDGSNGLYEPKDGDQTPWWFIDNTWTGSNSRDYESAQLTSSVDLASQPRYIVEELGTVTNENDDSIGPGPLTESGMYRVTARAQGSNPNTVVILQTYFKR